MLSSLLQTVLTIFTLNLACAQEPPNKGFNDSSFENLQESLDALDRMQSDLDSIGPWQITSVNIYRARYPQTASVWPILDRLESLFLERERLLYSVTPTSPGVARIDHSIRLSMNDLNQSVEALREILTHKMERRQNAHIYRTD